MWYSSTDICLAFASLLSQLSTADPRFHREFRQQQSERIATARANDLAHPRNTTALAFGPQLYEAPLLCDFPELIIPQAYDVSLGRGHSIADHQPVIVDDIRLFIWQSVPTLYLEKIYWVKHVDTAF